MAEREREVILAPNEFAYIRDIDAAGVEEGG